MNTDTQITATYTIFDGDGSGSGTAWPSHDGILVDGDDLDDVLAHVRDALDVAAVECSIADGYSVGDTITAYVYHDEGTEFVRHTLTAEDLGASKEDVGSWETVASYVATFATDGGEGACDVDVRIGESGGVWFVRTADALGGSDDADDTAYSDEGAARTAAVAFAMEHTAAAPGEDAKDYLTRKASEAAGEPDPAGNYCVYWTSAIHEDEGPRARYATDEQAVAAAKLADDDLHQSNPGQLLCGFEARQLVDGQWVALDEGEG